MPVTIAVVQARMGSTRMPGKSLAPMWRGRSMLELVLTRMKKSRALDLVVLATSELPGDDALEPVAAGLGVPVVRGSEDDVLGRYCDTVRQYPADAIVRVCADNPLVDPLEIDRLVEYFWENQPAEYACNDRLDCGLPDGAGAEIMSAGCLARLDATVTGDLRQHVCMYVPLHQDEFSVLRLQAEGQLHRPEIALDVDYPEDAEFVGKLIGAMDQEKAPFWTTLDAIEALDRSPELLKIRRASPAAGSAPAAREGP